MSKYDEKAVRAFDAVSEAVRALRLPLMQQRRYTGITNAIAMQIEDGHPNKEVIEHLASALAAFLRADGFAQQAEAMQKLLAAFERKIESRFK